MMRQRLSLYKLVSFDVTGTLVRLRHPPGTIYERVGREFGYEELDTKALDKGFRSNFKVLSNKYPNYGRELGMHWATWWSLLVERTFKDADKSKVIDPGHLKTISRRLIELYETDECWTAAENAVDFVRHVKEQNIRTCIITNSDPRISAVLRNLGFPEFDFILSAFDTGLMKPDPTVFQLALGMIKDAHVKPNEAMHIGNDTELDYTAANNSAWTGVLINPDLPVEEPHNFKYKSLTSFMDTLKKSK